MRRLVGSPLSQFSLINCFADRRLRIASRLIVAASFGWFAITPAGDAPPRGATIVPSDGEFTSLFDGKSLDGWRCRDMSFWSIEDEAITGTITPTQAPTMNQYLVWRGGLIDDFELNLSFRLTGSTTPNTNGGFQFRSRLLPNGDVAGYQVDNNFGMPWKVRLYDEFGRHDLALEGEKNTFDAIGVKKIETLAIAAESRNFSLGRRHEYHLTAAGRSLKLSINGTPVAETTDDDRRNFEPAGVLAL